MNIKTSLLFLGLAVLVFSSCSNLYTPALYHQDIAYQPKPSSFDKENAATYISAGIGANTNVNFNDFLVSGQLNLSQGFIFDHFNVAYGGFAVFGDYQNGSSDVNKPNYFSDKFFGALGGRASVNAFVTSGRADIRFIGIEMAYSHEFGDYADFRQRLNTQPGYFVDPRVNLLSIGLTTEVIFHNRNNSDFQHGIRGYLGTTLGHNQLNDTYYTDQTVTDRMFRSFYPKASYFIKFNNYFGAFEVGSQVLVRFGYKF
ncbi:hypothetical protein BH09BAC6_BH09BAC6_36920 [soil metagenome]|jgi:hypothetical protein